MGGVIYAGGPNGLWIFLVLTIVLGGAAAMSAGRALAKSWRPFWQAVPYMACLAAFVRFLHYALFAEDLLSLPYYATEFAACLAFAALGFYATRRRQMRLQYGWTDDGVAR